MAVEIRVRPGETLNEVRARIHEVRWEVSKVDLSGLDTSMVTNMGYLFHSCRNLKALDLSTLDTRCVMDVRRMFKGCESLHTLDLSGWDMHGVQLAHEMFHGCKNLRIIVASCETATRLREAGAGMPKGCVVVQPDDVWREEAETVGPKGADDVLTAQPGETVYSVRTRIEEACDKLVEADLTALGTVGTPSLGGLFQMCRKMRTVELGNLDTGAVTDMSYLFDGCYRLQALDLSGLDTHMVLDMERMFGNCEDLKSLDLSGFDTGSLICTNDMFYGCERLEYLDLTGWDAGGVIDAVGMFKGCVSLHTIVASDETIGLLESSGAELPDGCMVVRPEAMRRKARW